MNLKAKKLLNDDEDAAFLQSLREDFYLETLDSMEKSEAALLDFEASQNELKKLEYKRILHSIKGSAKAVGDDAFAKIIHVIEDSLSSVSHDSMDFHLKFLDAAREYIKLRMQGSDDSANNYLGNLESLANKK